MLKERASNVKSAQADPPSGQPATLTFNPATAVQGIVYHLMDEKLAKSISEETVHRTVDRLAAKSFHPSIAKSVDSNDQSTAARLAAFAEPDDYLGRDRRRGLPACPPQSMRNDTPSCLNVAQFKSVTDL